MKLVPLFLSAIAALAILSGCATSSRVPSKRGAAPMKRTLTTTKPASVPLTEPAPVMWIVQTNRINLAGCDTNDVNCVLYFMTRVSVVQLAGTELTLGFSEIAHGPQWSFAARFGAGPVDRISEFTWLQPEWQRPPKLFFKSWSVIPILPSASAEPVNIVSPAFGGLATATSRKK